MSTAWCRWALAFFFTSALAAGAAPGEASTTGARAAEMEAGLATKREVYLVVGVTPATLAIRVRGVTLEELPIASVAAHEWRRLSEPSEVEPLVLPRVLVTAATISLVDRKVVAPDTLKPWSDEAETGRPATGDEARPAPPASYDVPLEGGWILEIRQEGPSHSATRRFLAAMADGWARVAGRGHGERRTAIRFVMEEAAAVRLHHLFKKGTAILLVPDLGFRER
jgi:hypothetical protein